MTPTILIAIAIATLIPFGVLLLIRRVDKYRTGNFRFIGMSFIWGLIAYLIAAQINPLLIDFGVTDYNGLVRYYAPVIEEILKVIIIVLLVRQASFTYFVDGTLFGFAVGIGFAIVENYEYVLGNADTAIFQAVARVISTNLMHATASGVLGIAFGRARMQRSGKRNLYTLTGLVLAIIIHIAFNNLVTRVSSGLLLLYAAIVGIGGAAFIALIMRNGFSAERDQMEETLEAVQGITAQEASAVKQVDQMKKFLAPVVEKFGIATSKKVEKFLRLQAKLGILQKSAARFAEIDDEKMQKSTEAQVERIHLEMDELRREVGSYCMVYLRGTFLQADGALWGRLENIINASAQKPRDPNAPSLWGNLNTKIKSE